MEWHQLQILAGSLSSLIFIGGTLSMLWKAWKTRDMTSYSVSGLALNTFGNLMNWLYVLSLPFGPIYFLHTFHTIATAFMLIGSVVYRHHPVLDKRITQTVQKITQELSRSSYDLRRQTSEIPTVTDH